MNENKPQDLVVIIVTCWHSVVKHVIAVVTESWHRLYCQACDCSCHRVLTQAILSSVWLQLTQSVDTGYIVKHVIVVVTGCWHRLYCQVYDCSCHRVLTQALLSRMLLQLSQSVDTGYIIKHVIAVVTECCHRLYCCCQQSVDTGYIVKRVMAVATECWHGLHCQACDCRCQRVTWWWTRSWPKWLSSSRMADVHRTSRRRSLMGCSDLSPWLTLILLMTGI